MNYSRKNRFFKYVLLLIFVFILSYFIFKQDLIVAIGNVLYIGFVLFIISYYENKDWTFKRKKRK